MYRPLPKNDLSIMRYFSLIRELRHRLHQAINSVSIPALAVFRTCALQVNRKMVALLKMRATRLRVGTSRKDVLAHPCVWFTYWEDPILVLAMCLREVCRLSRFLQFAS